MLSPNKSADSFEIFGALAKLRVANIAPEFLPVCPSICPYLTPRLQVGEFLSNSIYDYFPKTVKKFQDSVTSGKNNDYHT
jgi:hypothetical protein